MQVDRDTLVEEKKMAKYSKTAEFKRIQKHCAERIEFYQKYLPNGAEVALDVRPTAEDWSVANRVIGELKLLMNMYEVATEAVEQSNE
jgi:hypothetical protein